MIPIFEALRSRLRVIKADITTLNVDAIVNSADADLTGGGEVDKAIHKAAGPELRKACRTYVLEQGRCFAGGASLTESFNLPCRFVIHAVGPTWVGGGDGEVALLARAYARSFELARLHGARTIAFPAIATGQYGFPKPTAAAVALTVAVQVLELEPQFESVTFCTYDDDTRQIYEALIEEGYQNYLHQGKQRPPA